MGWVGYFHIASAKNHCKSLDRWIRRRLRICLWKQWKRCVRITVNCGHWVC
ncbi:group II intron maturase-specific domain-containing protein [Carboxydocella sp. ULO1]|uniref:group II intron maturase-specific domain-containing protein n=1 Tax=Carboxydocella sp. ULO1 TaxID=1926599 RepID=UPI00190EDD4F